MSAVSTAGSQLIISTTGEQPLYHDEDKEFSKRQILVGKLGESISRLGFYVSPVEKFEIYDIVRTRLVQQESINENVNN